MPCLRLLLDDEIEDLFCWGGPPKPPTCRNTEAKLPVEALMIPVQSRRQ
jgi:hypothetical protein